ncbi:MAG: FAD:protein FMN transferase, partial [Bacteroidota bacterium]
MQSYYRQIRAMGTRLDMVFPGTGEEQGELVVALIDREVKRLEDMLSFFDPASELSRINAAEPGSPVTVSAEMKQILIMVQDYARKTGGYFDITSRPVSDWLKKNPGGETPPPDLIACTGMDKFEIEDHSLIRKAPGLILDPGGFGKGYALEKVKQILHKTKIPCAFISFGESSLYAHGHHPYGDFWIAGINDPIDGSSTGYTFA